MPNYLNRIIYLTEAQKDTIFDGGTVTANGHTISYDPNDIYITSDGVEYLPLTGGTLTGTINMGMGSFKIKYGTTAPASAGLENNDIYFYIGDSIS